MKLSRLLYVWTLATVLVVIGVLTHVALEIAVAVFFAVLISAAILSSE